MVSLTNVTLKAFFLITIMIMSFAITSSLAKGQLTTTNQTASTDSTVSQSNNINLKDVLDQRCLGLLGLDSNVTGINSSLNSTDDAATKGYSYVGNFISSGKSYLVESTQYETTNGNQTISTVTQNISGAADSYCVSTENDTTIDNVLLSQDDWTVQTSNCSGNYQLTMNSVGQYDSDTFAPIDVQAELYQNFSGPIGHYSLTLSPLQSNVSEEDISTFQGMAASVSEPEMILAITSPDGVQSTANLIPSSSNGQSNSSTDNYSLMDSGSNGPLGDFTIPVPNDISSTLFDPLLSFQNSNMLTGFFIYWDQNAGAVIGTAMFLIGLAAGALAAPTMGASVAILTGIITVIGGVLAVSYFFPANLSGETINIMYFELKFYLAWGFFPVPYYAETGYYTNYVDFLGDVAWTFFDVFDTWHFWIALDDTLELYSHSGVWPASLAPDVEVTFRAVVENSDNDIANVGFSVDGSWDFESGLSYWLPTGTHAVYAANPGGALNWIDQDGVGQSGCPVMLTISGDTTITAHYYHWNQIQVGCVSSLSSMAWSAVLEFSQNPSYTLGDGNPTDDSIGTVELNQNSNFNFTDGSVYALVAEGSSNGGFDVGLVDRPPTVAEWASMPNLQLWAVGYGGDPNVDFNASGLVWMVTNNQLSTGATEDMAKGLFISWAHKTAMQNQDLYHNLDDMTGARDVDSNFNLYTPPSGSNQTQSIPDGVVNGNDFFYFVDAYIAYYASGIYNPYADTRTQGVINGVSFLGFVAAYLAYYENYNPTDSSVSRQNPITDMDNNQQSEPSGVFSAVQQGTTNSVWTVGPSPNPINSTVEVDVRIDNASNIWGWIIPNITWNASVLQLTKVVEGGFLSDNTGSDSIPS